MDSRKLIDLSNLVERIYTSTRLCVPKNLDVCSHPEKLWNFTFIQTENDVRQLTFDPNDGTAETEPQNVFLADLICLKGEPDLENLMANGEKSVERSKSVRLENVFSFHKILKLNIIGASLPISRVINFLTCVLS